jgi:hypothetical protein
MNKALLVLAMIFLGPCVPEKLRDRPLSVLTEEDVDCTQEWDCACGWCPPYDDTWIEGIIWGR